MYCTSIFLDIIFITLKTAMCHYNNNGVENAIMIVVVKEDEECVIKRKYVLAPIMKSFYVLNTFVMTVS
jgi:hypothetical protein